MKRRIENIKNLGDEASKKEQDEGSLLRVALEMLARGYTFEPIHLGISHYDRFGIYEGKVIIPISSLPGIGKTIAKEIYDEYKKGPFLSVEDMIKRTGASKTVIEALTQHGALNGVPKDNQLSMLDLFGSQGNL